MGLLWQHQPHACKTCGMTLATAHPTCPSEACRVPWRRKSWNAARAARRAVLSAAHRCADCRKLLRGATAYRCQPCAKKHRDALRARARDAAYEAYRGKLAFAHAEREIAKKIAKKAAQDREEEAKAYREARELADRGWRNEDGEVMYEEP